MDNYFMQGTKIGIQHPHDYLKGQYFIIIALFNSSQVDVLPNSLPHLAVCNSLAIHLFLGIKKQTLKLVASTYDLVASSNVFDACAHQI